MTAALAAAGLSVKMNMVEGIFRIAKTAGRQFYGKVIKIKPVHELYGTASDFELLVEEHIENLKRYKENMFKEKDASVLKSISKTLYVMEEDIKEYREWAERESQAMEK